ncbi:MAG: hypothetical protein R3A47_01605 [Polyangiales bacterium]
MRARLEAEQSKAEELQRSVANAIEERTGVERDLQKANTRVKELESKIKEFEERSMKEKIEDLFEG